MPQDAFTLHHAALELDGLLKNAKTERINQTDKNSVVFQLRCADKVTRRLFVSANADGARVCVTKRNDAAPLSAPAFCMLLRKHLSRSSISKIEAVPFERIVEITFDAKDELGVKSTKKLICEVMGKYSNVTLVENGKVLGAIHSTDFDFNLQRPVFPGATFIYPKPQDKINADDTPALKSALAQFEGTTVSADALEEFAFSRFKGLARQTAAGLSSSFTSNQITRGVKAFKTDDFIKYFQDFYFSPECKPNVVFSPLYSDFFIIDDGCAEGEKRCFSTINDAVDYFFTKKEERALFKAKVSKLSSIVNKKLKKLEKNLQIAEEKLLSCRNADELTLKGQLLISYAYKIKSGEKKVALPDYTKEGEPLIEIKLDDKLTPVQNAEVFFKKYGKLKKTEAAVSPQREELLSEIEYLKTVLVEIEKAESAADFDDVEEELKQIGLIRAPKTKERKKTSQFRLFSYKGYDVRAGRNNLQNDRLVAESDRNDVWLHAKGYRSSHVVIKSHGNPVPEEVILFAAELCAFYSGGKQGDKIPVDYALKKHVKKPSGAKPGLVYYTNQKTLLVTPKPQTEYAAN